MPADHGLGATPLDISMPRPISAASMASEESFFSFAFSLSSPFSCLASAAFQVAPWI
jgi:hypothetical protein